MSAGRRWPSTPVRRRHGRPVSRRYGRAPAPIRRCPRPASSRRIRAAVCRCRRNPEGRPQPPGRRSGRVTGGATTTRTRRSRAGWMTRAAPSAGVVIVGGQRFDALEPDAVGVDVVVAPRPRDAGDRRIRLCHHQPDGSPGVGSSPGESSDEVSASVVTGRPVSAYTAVVGSGLAGYRVCSDCTVYSVYSASSGGSAASRSRRPSSR